MTIEFHTFTTSEKVLAAAIGLRMQRTGDREATEVVMDLAAVMHHTKLDLAFLLDFPDESFFHDVMGIAHHLDRDDNSPTGGQLLGGFAPRCSQGALQ